MKELITKDRRRTWKAFFLLRRISSKCIDALVSWCCLHYSLPALIASTTNYLHVRFCWKSILTLPRQRKIRLFSLFSKFSGGRRGKFRVAVATLPPPDDHNLLGWLFELIVDFLAAVEPSLFTLLVKLAFSCLLGCTAMFFLWRTYFRHRALTIVACLLGFFLGLWCPMSWFWIEWETLRAFVVLCLIFVLIGACWALPFFWTASKREQRPLRFAIACVFVLLVAAHALCKRFHII